MANWVKFGKASLIADGMLQGKEFGDVRVCVAKVNGACYAIGDVCTHAEGYLSDGELIGVTVECPLHGAQFDVTTGAVKQMPATEPVATYPVKIEDDELYVDLG